MKGGCHKDYIRRTYVHTYIHTYQGSVCHKDSRMWNKSQIHLPREKWILYYLYALVKYLVYEKQELEITSVLTNKFCVGLCVYKQDISLTK